MHHSAQWVDNAFRGQVSFPNSFLWFASTRSQCILETNKYSLRPASTDHHRDVTWASWRLESPASRHICLAVCLSQHQRRHQCSICITGLLRRESTGDQWISLTKRQWCGKRLFMLWRLHIYARFTLNRDQLRTDLRVEKLWISWTREQSWNFYHQIAS